MLWCLLKKQFTELFKGYFVNKKTGKLRSKKGIFGFFILFAFIMLSVAAMFFGVADMLCATLVKANLSWLYFAIMGLLATALGTFGSVFNTYAGIYHAKDNELLLSMPIKPSTILLSRIIGVYSLGLLYESAVFIPAMICYLIKGKPSVLSVIFLFLLLFILCFFITSLTCFLGWIVALISGKLRQKNIIVVIISVVFLGLYYAASLKLNSFLTMLVSNAEKIGNSIKSAVFPAYAFGLASTGKVLYMLFFTVFSLACFGVTYYIMSKSFTKIVTASDKSKKKTLKNGKTVLRNVGSALLFKELKRFLASPTYMLNGGLGIVIMPVLGIAALIKSDLITGVFKSYPEIAELIPVIAVSSVCLVSSIGSISACSVSLEGKNIWVTQSLPIKPYKILQSKIKLHFLLISVPAAVLTVLLCIALNEDFVTTILSVITVLAYLLVYAQTGLALDLKMPNLTWTNEVVPIKQGMPVMFSLFGGWFVSVIISGMYYPLKQFISAQGYIAVCFAILMLTAFLLDKHFRGKGAEKFINL